MKVVEKLVDFPAEPPRLRGLNAEAYELLKDLACWVSVGGQVPVLVAGLRAALVAALS